MIWTDSWFSWINESKICIHDYDDVFLAYVTLVTGAKESLKSSSILQAESHLHFLILQSQAIQAIVDCVPKAGIEQ